MGSNWPLRALTYLFAPIAFLSSGYLLFLMGWYAVADAREGPSWGTPLCLAVASLIPLGGLIIFRGARRRGDTGHLLVLEVSAVVIGITCGLAIGLVLISAAATGM